LVRIGAAPDFDNAVRGGAWQFFAGLADADQVARTQRI
jgi:hypothetical protein